MILSPARSARLAAQQPPLFFNALALGVFYALGSEKDFHGRMNVLLQTAFLVL